VGLSAQRSKITFLDSAPPTGDVRLVGIDEGKTLLPEIYSRIWRERAGMVTRTDFWWPAVFWDYMFGGGKKAEFLAIHRNEQGIDDGWVAYESQGDWTDGLPHGTLQAWDLLGADANVRAALERYCFEVDLLDRVEFVHAPVDDPLRHMVTDPRRVRVDYVNDGLWIAPLDPQVLLGGRTYATPGRLVLDIEGTAYAIEATDDKVSVEVSADAPDLACNAAVLGMTILGGNRWDELASAGRVAVHNANALALANQMFATSPAPALFTGF
jgi:predicted acetyltransferase